MQYPADDDAFKEYTIEKVDTQSDGSYAITCDGWTLWCGEECRVTPEVGQIARQYGRGTSVRGLFINGSKVWYRTEPEEKEHREIQIYGADARDWLKRWDSGQSVWSIEMGGLGPGYEQCIHITAAEILRWLIEHNTDASAWDDKDRWKADRADMEKALFEVSVVKRLGLSGAQWGAAVSMATALYAQGPRKVMSDPKVKDRLIQVSKNFPGSVVA